MAGVFFFSLLDRFVGKNLFLLSWLLYGCFCVIVVAWGGEGESEIA